MYVINGGTVSGEWLRYRASQTVGRFRFGWTCVYDALKVTCCVAWIEDVYYFLNNLNFFDSYTQ